MAFNQDKEKRRARLAYCLTRWIRPGDNGKKIPATEAGIVEHKNLVEAYGDIYGPPSAAGMRQYENIYALVRKGLEQQQVAEKRAAKVMSAQADKKEQADEQRRAQRRENTLRRQRLEAERTLKALPQSMAIQRKEINRLKEYIARDEVRVAQLESSLAGKYRNSPLRKDIEAALADAKKRCQNFQERIPEVEADLAENKQVCDEARAMLKQNSTVTISKPKLQWKPSWDKSAFSKFRDLKNIPKDWSVERLVLIWRGEDQQELRVIAPSEDTANKVVNILLSQQSFEVLPHLSGNRWNFKITREQYRQIGEV